MRKLIRRCERMLTWCNAICLRCSMVLLIGMLAIVCLNVLLRYIFSYSITWTEESARFMMVWITFLLFPYAQQKGQLVAVDFLALRIRYTRPGVMLAIFLELLTLAVLVGCLYQSFGFVQRAGATISMALQLPMWAVSLVLPYSFAMTLLASLLWFCRLVPCLTDPCRLMDLDNLRGSEDDDPAGEGDF